MVGRKDEIYQNAHGDVGAVQELVQGQTGICILMKELGLFDLTPAMCRLDDTMSEAGGANEFVRKYTLASGGPYCDCGYKKKPGSSFRIR